MEEDRAKEIYESVMYKWPKYQCNHCGTITSAETTRLNIDVPTSSVRHLEIPWTCSCIKDFPVETITEAVTVLLVDNIYTYHSVEISDIAYNFRKYLDYEEIMKRFEQEKIVCFNVNLSRQDIDKIQEQTDQFINIMETYIPIYLKPAKR